MRFWSLVALLAAAVATVSAQTSSATFDVMQCYQDDPTTFMPNTLDNLIALIEKYESTQTFSSMEELAEVLLKRYRKDGIVYRPDSSVTGWTANGLSKASKKQELIDLVLRPTQQPDIGTFDIREECALHRMLSHSTDDYPISGINEIWTNPLSSSSSSSSRGKRALYSSNSNSLSQTRYEAAVHPVERGVIETPYGPVAGGTLLAGIMAISQSPGSSIQTVLGATETEFMKSEMKTSTLIPVYAATLAGDLGEMALWSRPASSTPVVGPAGRFHNCTTCSQQFSHETNVMSFLSRAELFAGLDALILAKAYSENGVSGTNSLMLSQLLHMYYSEKGLPGMSDYKACNRLQLYQSVSDKTILTQQVLSFMYAYAVDFPDEKLYIQTTDSYATIEAAYLTAANTALQAMETFIGSYNYDDEGASQCYFSSLGGNQWSSGTTSKFPQSEGSTDLVAVYAEEGTTEYMEKERQMIADVARRVGVSTYRSRLAVLRAKDATWIQTLQNISNIADWGCNFTTDTLYSGGSSSQGDLFTVVLTGLANFYREQYNLAFSDMQSSSGRSQVVLWQVPAAMPGDLETNKNAIRAFRLAFPDVSIIFVGRNQGPYIDMLDDDDDFISYSGKTLRALTDETVSRIQLSPRFFMYPACDPSNSTESSTYTENSHIYEGAVSPNLTTYIRIPPQNFHYSEELTLKVSGSVRACFSRTNRLALEDYSVVNIDSQRTPLPDDQLQCIGGPDDDLDEVTYKWLCDRYIYTCSPVYVSVTGLSTTGGRTSCSSGTNPECEYPNQIQYTLSHEGMICGASSTAPALLLLLLPAILQYFQQ